MSFVKCFTEEEHQFGSVSQSIFVASYIYFSVALTKC